MRPVTSGAARAFRVDGEPTLRVVVAQAGLACCVLEVDAALTRGLLVPDSDEGPADRVILLVAGTVTDALAPAVLALHAALAVEGASVMVVSFGACANTGGPYWDAPTVTKGIDQLLPVATYVPGCPPSPEALVAGLRALAREPSMSGGGT